MFRRKPLGWLIFLLLWASEARAETRTFSISPDLLVSFKIERGRFLGLSQITCRGKTLLDPQFPTFPVLSRDWGWDSLVCAWKWKTWEKPARAGMPHCLVLEAWAIPEKRAIPSLFALDRKHRIQKEARLWKSLFEDLGRTDAQVRKWMEEREKWNGIPVTESDWNREIRLGKMESLDVKLRNHVRRLVREKLLPAGLLPLWENLEKDQAGYDVPTLRDQHGYPVPEPRFWADLNPTPGPDEGRLLGEVRWYFDPVELKVGEFPASGWRQWWTWDFPNHPGIQVFRQWEGWACSGKPENQVLVNFRYRGLGKIEQVLHPDSGTAFTTADIWPGYPLDSARLAPKRMVYTEHQAFAASRSLANLVALPRGGGVSPFDFFARESEVWVRFSPKPGNLRSVSDWLPGYPIVSTVWEERQAEQAKGRGYEQVYLCFGNVSGKRSDRWALRTLWARVDAWIRQKHLEYLGLPDILPQPAIGMNWDVHNPQKSYARAARNLAASCQDLRQDGVKWILNHTSGWHSGGSIRNNLDGELPEQYDGGGSCNVYDYRPVPHLTPAWLELKDSLWKYEIGYFAWLTAMVHKRGEFARDIRDPDAWASLRPDTTWNPVYGNWMGKFNPANPNLQRILQDRVQEMKERFGIQGLWLDSWHNLWLSQTDWKKGGLPSQELWWKSVKNWARQEIFTMAESHSSPGLSCSIEVLDWEQQAWYFNHTVKWLRNGEHKRYATRDLNRLLFHIAASGGWLAFDILEYGTDGPYIKPGNIIPDFPSLAHCYQQVRGHMADPVFSENGTLWKDRSGNERVWFGEKKNLPMGWQCLWEGQSGCIGFFP